MRTSDAAEIRRSSKRVLFFKTSRQSNTLWRYVGNGLLALGLLLSMPVYTQQKATRAQGGSSPAVQEQHSASAEIAETHQKTSPSFNIWEFEIHGAYLLPEEKIQEAMQAYIGPNKAFTTVDKAAKALEELYKTSGYPIVVVSIPEQEVVGGRVRLDVLEGKVSRVRVSNSRYFLLSKIRDFIPSLQEGQALNVIELQEELKYVNALNSDLRIIPVIKEGKAPGDVEVDLRVKDSLPLSANIELNNYASANTTDKRLNISLGYNNMWNLHHGWSFQYLTTPEDTSEINVLSTTYVMPLGSSVNRLAVYAVQSDSDLNTFSSTSSGLQVRGDNKIFGARYVMPRNYTTGFQQVVTAGFDYKDVYEEVGFPSSDTEELITPIDYSVFTGEYKGIWRKKNSLRRLGGGVIFAPRRFGNKVEEFEDKRYRGEPNFIYWKVSGSWNQRLLLGTTLEARLKMQYADAPLISNEQISIGGMSTVRGYLESQQMGDRGAIIGTDFYSPQILRKVDWVNDFRIFTFWEGGTVETLEPLDGQDDSALLTSAGLGLNFRAFKSLSIDLNWTFPLKDVCGTELCSEPSDIEKGETRTLFSLQYTY